MTNTEKIPFSYSFGNSCRNFSANIFDATKCKNCMKPREEHCGVEDAKVKARPVHYGWLLVAPPGWTPVVGSAMGSRRWQRRFFVLYELGTLNWSLDDEVGTDPAGVLDLNKPYQVSKADDQTQLSNTICITSLNNHQDKTIIRAETREECIFWYRSLAKMIDDSKERQKQTARRNKMLALRRRHHTVSSTGQNTAIEEAKKMNQRDKRHQTIDNSQSVSNTLFQATYNRRERPQSMVTNSAAQPPFAPSSPTELCTIESRTETRQANNAMPAMTQSNDSSNSPPGNCIQSVSEPARPGRSNAIRRNHSIKVEPSASYQPNSNIVPPRSSSVDRRLNYGRDRLNSYEQVMTGKNVSIKQSWLSVVDAANINEAKKNIGKKLWFAVSPGKLIAYSNPSTQESEFSIRLCSKTVVKELEHDSSSRYYQLLLTIPLNAGGEPDSEKSLIIGSLTRKICKIWSDSIFQAIEQSNSRSSSISSNEPTDITNKIERIPQQKTTCESVPVAVVTPASPSCENVEPEIVPSYTSSIADGVSNHRVPNVLERISPGIAGEMPVQKMRRRKKRDERPKTIDLGSMREQEQLLLSLQSEKQKHLGSPSPLSPSPLLNANIIAPGREKEVDLWDRITHIEPFPIAAKTAAMSESLENEPKSLTSSSSSIGSMSYPMSREKRLEEELDKVRKELERVKRESSEKTELLNKARLEKLAKTTSQDDKPRNDSYENEVFSTPPSSPQPPVNNQKSTQTNSSEDFVTPECTTTEVGNLAVRLQREEDFRKELEDELAKQKEETAKANEHLFAAQHELEQQSLEAERLRQRLIEVQTIQEAEKQHIENELRVNDRLKQINTDLLKEIEYERNRFNEVRNDLQIAIESISVRGPYINMDMPLNDLESRILRHIRLNT